MLRAIGRFFKKAITNLYGDVDTYIDNLVEKYVLELK